MSRSNNEKTYAYTDGACSNNGRGNGSAGYGVAFGENHPWNASGPVHGRQTNNSAEIQAAKQAIDIAGRNGVRDLTIRTDSEFLVNSHNKWMPKWEQNGWQKSDGRPVQNAQEFREMKASIRNNPQMNVEFEHVRGHNGNQYNEAADRLAREGARQNRRY